jgi:NTP pyrophosphatase (non-canonical NTP hydrolase)
VNEVKILQKQINDWHNKNFSDSNPMRNQLNLTEEVGELSRAIIKMEQGIRGTRADWLKEAYKELGDVFISLTNVAGALGIDLQEAITERWETISQRDWNADRIQHGIENSDG